MHDETTKELVESWDKQYLWHPFTQMKDFVNEEPLIIVDGRGVMLRDINGNEYIDGVSSMWCNIHGHRREEIDNAIKDQLDKVAHTTLLGQSNIPSVKLAKRLVGQSSSVSHTSVHKPIGSNSLSMPGRQ